MPPASALLALLAASQPGLGLCVYVCIYHVLYAPAGAQMGTLGAGNHYAEVQVVDRVFDHAAARKMGIDQEGQVPGLFRLQPLLL